MGGKAAIFSAETFRFFRELGRNNRKAWMDSNRERYRAHVVEPLRALLDALAPLAQQLNPDFDTSGRTGRNFSRINRDVRFAADKSPYRTQMYLTFSDQRSPDGDDGQLYVGVSPDAITSGFRISSSGIFCRAWRRWRCPARWKTPPGSRGRPGACGRNTGATGIRSRRANGTSTMAGPSSLTTGSGSKAGSCAAR